MLPTLCLYLQERSRRCRLELCGNCLVSLLIGYALQPTRVPSYPVPVIPTRENTPRPELGICGCGPCICGEPGASQGEWSETTREGIAFLFNPAVGFAIGVVTCVTLCFCHRSVSREIIVRAALIIARGFSAHSSTF